MYWCEWGGDSWESDCGCVASDNSGDECDDCAGEPNGSAWESDCGCVASDNSGDDCDDCAGEPNGDAVVDECGVCDGGNVCTGGNTLTAIISDHELISSMEAVLDSDPYVDQGTGFAKRDVKSITVNLTDGNSYTMIRDEENSDSGDREANNNPSEPEWPDWVETNENGSRTFLIPWSAYIYAGNIYIETDFNYEAGGFIMAFQNGNLTQDFIFSVNY